MNVYRYFAEYRYRPPMPLEDVSKHYFYCTPGGLPPLAPRKKTVKVKPTRTNNKNNSNNNNIVNINNNNIINTTPATTAVIVPSVPTTLTLPTATTAADVDYFEEEARAPCWWGWTVYYWFMHTFPRWYKFFGLIYLFLVDFFTGKDWVDAGDDNNINNNINVDNEVVKEEVDEDEWIHGVSHVAFNYDYYDDEVPIQDEFAPPEAEEQLDFEALRLLLPQQEEEPTATSSVNDIATTIVDVPYNDLEDDDDDDDDGSDYYFSLPSENAINTFGVMDVSEGEAGDDVNFGTAEAEEIEDIMPVLEAFGATEDEDVPEATLATEDATEDVEASTTIDEVTAALGSIWVPDPQFGMVRRSTRLRVRG